MIKAGTGAFLILFCSCVAMARPTGCDSDDQVVFSAMDESRKNPKGTRVLAAAEMNGLTSVRFRRGGPISTDVAEFGLDHQYRKVTLIRRQQTHGNGGELFCEVESGSRSYQDIMAFLKRSSVNNNCGRELGKGDNRYLVTWSRATGLAPEFFQSVSRAGESDILRFLGEVFALKCPPSPAGPLFKDPAAFEETSKFVFSLEGERKLQISFEVFHSGKRAYSRHFRMRSDFGYSLWEGIECFPPDEDAQAVQNYELLKHVFRAAEAVSRAPASSGPSVKVTIEKKNDSVQYSLGGAGIAGLLPLKVTGPFHSLLLTRAELCRARAPEQFR